jgi:glutamate synthase domain-containing protein 2
MKEECGCGMHHGKHDDYCGCGMHGQEQGYRRRFLTKAEKTERLKNYAEELRNELKAVEEKIKEMQS